MTRRRIAGWLLALVAGLLAVLAPSVPASAHSTLVGSTPANGAQLTTRPTGVELRFDEPVEAVPAGMKLYAPAHPTRVLPAQVRDSVVLIALPEDLPSGRSSVAYHVISADGHPVSGVVSFAWGDGTRPSGAPGESNPAGPDSPETIQTASPVTETALSVLTGGQLAGILGFAGLLLAGRLILPRRLVADEPGWVGRTLGGCWALALACSVALVPVMALSRQGSGPAGLLDGAWLAVVSPASLWAAGLVLISGPGLLLRRRLGFRALGVVAALLAPALIGHPTSPGRRAWMVPADLVHLGAAAFWIGGLAWMLWLVVPAGRRRCAAGEAARVVSRFSTGALVAVLAIVASGVVMALGVLTDPAELLACAFGRQLVVKVVIVGCGVAFAAWNRFVLLPAVRRSEAGAGTGNVRERGSDPGSWRRLRRGMQRELALIGLVLAVTGFLTNQSPHGHDHSAAGPTGTPAAGSPPEAGIREVSADSQGLHLQGRLSPGQVGENRFEFTLRHDGRPVDPATVQVQARLPAEGLGPIAVPVTGDVQTAQYAAALDLPAPGRWQLQVSVKVSEFEQPLALVEVPVA